MIQGIKSGIWPSETSFRKYKNVHKYTCNYDMLHNLSGAYAYENITANILELFYR